MNSVSKDINAVKYLINYTLLNGREPYNNKPFSKYSRGYFCTNENIKKYLELVKVEQDTKALSVLASGDHVFNLITKGITNIDTFDINRLSLYIALGLKRAMIIKYNYLKYLEVCYKLTNPFLSLNDLGDIINELLPLMNKKIRKFWQEIISFNYERQKNYQNSTNLFYLITQNTYGFKKSTRGNIFLENENEYNKLRNKIASVNINFQNNDIMNLPDQKYNIILLSNILTYYESQYQKAFNKEERKMVLSKLENLLKDEGIIFLNYFFENEALKQKEKWQNIKDEGYTYLSIPPLSYLYEEDNVVYKRIK